MLTSLGREHLAVESGYSEGCNPTPLQGPCSKMRRGFPSGHCTGAVQPHLHCSLAGRPYGSDWSSLTVSSAVMREPGLCQHTGHGQLVPTVTALC